MKILLADDSKFMRTILKGILEKNWKNAEFHEAGTGDETIAQYRTVQPDLMLLDLIMPGKGGLDVLKDIGTAKRGKIIVISAIGQDTIMQEAMKLGADMFIVKPFDERKVIEVIQSKMAA